MKQEIKIEVINVDEGDETIHFLAFFNNGFCSVKLEFYDYSDVFQSFASQLIDFPTDITDNPTFVLGEKERSWAYYLRLEAYCFEKNGQSAIKVEATNNDDGHSLIEAKFQILSEPASINRLGTDLKNWNPKKEGNFVWQTEN